jgi:hypothetical protein
MTPVSQRATPSAHFHWRDWSQPVCDRRRWRDVAVDKDLTCQEIDGRYEGQDLERAPAEGHMTSTEPPSTHDPRFPESHTKRTLLETVGETSHSLDNTTLDVALCELASDIS